MTRIFKEVSVDAYDKLEIFMNTFGCLNIILSSYQHNFVKYEHFITLQTGKLKGKSKFILFVQNIL